MLMQAGVTKRLMGVRPYSGYQGRPFVMHCEFRNLAAEDEPVIWQMLMYAAHEAMVVEAIQNQPSLARYAAHGDAPATWASLATADGRPQGGMVKVVAEGGKGIRLD